MIAVQSSVASSKPLLSKSRSSSANTSRATLATLWYCGRKKIGVRGVTPFAVPRKLDAVQHAEATSGPGRQED